VAGDDGDGRYQIGQDVGTGQDQHSRSAKLFLDRIEGSFGGYAVTRGNAVTRCGPGAVEDERLLRLDGTVDDTAGDAHPALTMLFEAEPCGRRVNKVLKFGNKS
jgi:hypothetical protein